MTDERLAELRAWIPGLAPLPRMWATELLAEVDRLRAELRTEVWTVPLNDEDGLDTDAQEGE